MLAVVVEVHLFWHTYLHEHSDVWSKSNSVMEMPVSYEQVK